MVVWFIGISGSGKTTLANELKKKFDIENIKSYIIDGDFVRDFFERDLGYSKKDRIENIKRVIIAAKILEENGIVAIVANISPFEELRSFCRTKFQNYIEIYLKRNLKNIKNKDFVYKTKSVVGVDLEFEEPKHSDLILQTDNLSIAECMEKILKVIDDKNR